MRTKPGIHSIKVALLAERAVIEYDPDQWSTEKLVDVSPLFYRGHDFPAKMSVARPS